MSSRLISTCSALNVLVSLLSLLTLIAIFTRRCEGYTITSLILIILVSSFNGFVDFYAVYSDTIWVFRNNTRNSSNRPLITMVTLMYAIGSGMLLYASIHASFALQFLRASLTVPLHFERRQRLDGNYFNMIEDIDKKVVRRTRIITALQILVGLASVAIVVFYVVPSADVYCLRFWYDDFLVEFLDVIKVGDW